MAIDPTDANCWTAIARGINPGIETKSGALELGETGRERRLTRVPVDGAELEGSALKWAGATKRPSLVEFQKGDPDLVRVKTDQVYTRDCQGNLGKPCGAMGIVAQGNTAWGDAGRLGTHPDALLAMREGSALTVTFAGGRRKGAGVRVIAFPTGFSHPIVFDAGDETGTPARPELDVILVLGSTEALEEVIRILEAGDAEGSPNTITRLKARLEREKTTARY